MKKITVSLLLALIFITGLALRLMPALNSELPLRFDSYYHARVAELINRDMSIPSWEPWPYGGRPHVYPPAYPLLLLFISKLFMTTTLNASRFVLPFISSLIVVAAFYFVRSFKSERAALIASFLISVNPYLVSSSYDSPQVIGILLLIIAVYFVFKKEFFKASILLASVFFFNPFSLVMFSVPLFAYLLIRDKTLNTAKTFSLPIITSILWLLLNFNATSCYNNWIGPLFIMKKINPWINFATPIFIFLPIIAFVMIKDLKDKFRFFWFISSIVFVAVFMLHFITPIFHPWRADVYLMLALSFLFSDSLSSLNWKNLFLFITLSMISLASLFSVFLASPLMMPPLTQNEYKLVDFISKNNKGLPILANHDMCSNILTLTNKSCLLDLNFECIPNATSWYDYEQFFWVASRQEMRDIINRNPDISYIAYSSGDWGRQFLESMDVDKVYSAWTDSSRDASLYKVNRIKGNITYMEG
ncbi:hypothetical protein DRN74_02095 [Candidatus Micrarchaeota archaeon]|nr:MAG: hypothetical protein DRN74_02095 [Candidatus Micrarchaeota archaeon]